MLVISSQGKTYSASQRVPKKERSQNLVLSYRMTTTMVACTP